LKILELFAGSKSFSSVAKAHGHEVFTSDIEVSFNTDYSVDILNFDISKLPWKPDVIWASPPCESFSVASIGKHWNVDNTPKTEKAELGVKLVQKTLEIIKQLEPKYYFMENPRGKLRKLPFMQDHPIRHTVTYCQYGDNRMKPTDIWTNCHSWNPRKMCKNGDTCHVAAPRGSKTGTQGISTYYDRSKVPEQLCEEIIKSIMED
jgi:hypothetical protein